MPEESLDWIGWLALLRFHRRRGADCAGRQPAPRPEAKPSLPGDLLVIVSLFIALAWILLSKKLMETHSPPVVTAYTILSGMAMLAVWFWARGCSIP